MSRIALLCGLAVVSAGSVRAQQPNSHPYATIGRELQPALNKPLKIIVSPAGIFVLDDAAPFVKRFDVHGRLQQGVGGFGTDPGQFTAPVGMGVDSKSNELLIVDAGAHQVTFYSLRDSLRLLHSFAVLHSASDVCVMNGHTYMLAYAKDHIVQEVERHGDSLQVVRAFGLVHLDAPLTDNAMAKQLLAFGLMACDPASGTIYTTSNNFGDVQVIPVGGGKQKSQQLIGVQPVKVTPRGRGLEFAAPADGNYDQPVALVAGQDGARVGLGVVTKGHKSGDYESFMEILVAHDGQQRSLGTSHAVFVGALGRRVVCYLPNPVPIISIYDQQTCP